MKIKLLVCALFAALLAAPLAANEKESKPWDIVQIGIWDGLGPNQNQVDVYGVRAGLPVCGGTTRVIGAEIGILGAATDEVGGFQWGVLAAVSKKISGVALGIFTKSVTVNGVQIGVVNVAKDRSFQVGLINVITDSPLTCFPFVNVKF